MKRYYVSIAFLNHNLISCIVYETTEENAVRKAFKAMMDLTNGNIVQSSIVLSPNVNVMEIKCAGNIWGGFSP